MLNKLISLFILKNKLGQPSYSTSMVVYAFGIINLKLLFSGINIMDKVKMSDFSGTDYAAALAAISGLHIFNKKVNAPNNDKEDK